MTATVPTVDLSSGRALPRFLSRAEDWAGPSWESVKAKSEQMSEAGIDSEGETGQDDGKGKSRSV